MKYAAKPKSATKKTNRNYKKSTSRSSKPSKSFTKAVESVIHKNTENKEVYHSVEALSFNSAINTTGDMQKVVPNCGVGTGEAERIGEQIRAQKLNIKGHFILSTSNNSIANSRIAVRMFVCQPKNLSAYPEVSNSTGWLQQLLRKGGSNVAFTGLISDLYAPVNTDQITCYYDKVTYITVPYLYQGIGLDSVNTLTSWDLVNSTKFFSISLKVKNKLLKYDKNYNTLQPTSYSPILVLGYTHLDNSSPDIVTTQVVMSYISTMEYEDL